MCGADSKAGKAIVRSRRQPGRCYAHAPASSSQPCLLQNKGLGPEAQIVTSSPEVRTQQLQPGDEFLLLACDGIWDVLTNQEVCPLAVMSNGAAVYARHIRL